ncbi:MAG: condensation domain-containing protein [Rhizonema sp. PD38]|nr:condensation domain-containing protein [Rhizonema sp. PD38]
MEAENIEDIYTLSPTQQGILFHVLSSPDSGVYQSQTTCILHGDLNVSAFEQAWQKVVDRHSTLRTGFVWEGLDKPVQIVYREVKLFIQQYDWYGFSTIEQETLLQNYLQADRNRSFELSKPPLIRPTVIKMTQNSYQLLWTSHHLVLDGWSGVIIQKEVFAFYEAFCQGKRLDLEPSRLYRDYIAWLKPQDISKAEIFWRQTLQRFTAPTPLFVNHSNAALPAKEEDYQQQEIYLSTTKTAAINSFARQHHLTSSTVVLGAWALLLSHYSGKKDVLFGKVMSGRPTTMMGVESMVGLFVNTLPVQVQISLEDSITSWLQGLQTQQIKLHQYEHTPLVQIQNWSELPKGIPLFESILVFQNTFVDVLNQHQESLKIEQINIRENTNYPLTISIIPESELCLKASFDLRRFHVTIITKILNDLAILLTNIANQPNIQLNTLIEILKVTEREQKETELQERKKSNYVRLKNIQPKLFTFSSGKIVKINYLQPDKTFPLVIQPVGENLDFIAWTQNNLEFIERKLVKHGAILFRNFDVSDLMVFEKFMRVISPELLEYRERSTPRTELGRNIYTSSEYPAHEHIVLHNEFSYAYTWPMKICFHCVKPAPQGGETPIADCRQVFQIINPKIRERFIQKKIMYVRNYGNKIDLSWQEAFQTKDKSVVEEYCRKAPMEFEWKDTNRLKTRQIRYSVARHPKTQEMVWFNQAHLFHISNLELEVREALLELFQEEDLPRNTYYGDGSPIETSVLDEVREAYQQASVSLPWQQGDVLLLDNMLVAHGRKPFGGTRKIVVAMGEPLTLEH